MGACWKLHDGALVRLDDGALGLEGRSPDAAEQERDVADQETDAAGRGFVKVVSSADALARDSALLAAPSSSGGDLGDDAERPLSAADVLREMVAQLPHASIPYMERVGAAAVGSVVVPEGKRRSASWKRFAFLLAPELLLVVDDDGLVAAVLEGLSQEEDRVASPAGVLCALVRVLLREHPVVLSAVREDFERFEETVLEGRGKLDRSRMMADSRRMLGLDGFYQGLSDLASELAEGGEGLVAASDRLHFKMLARQLDRLSARLESLQDYSLQVHSLYQESIDIRQNNVMQWLTVVATIAMPLTFITSWYGMNFRNMLLINTSWGYLVAVALCLGVAAFEIAFFHRRGWLSFGGGGRRRRRRG